MKSNFPKPQMSEAPYTTSIAATQKRGDPASPEPSFPVESAPSKRPGMAGSAKALENLLEPAQTTATSAPAHEASGEPFGVVLPVASPRAEVRLIADDHDKLRWATGFAAFWRKSTAEIGMPFTPLAQSICDHAVATQDSKTLLWLTEELRAPLLEPLDESEPEPCKAQMLQVIGKGLAKWPTNAAAPVWHSLLTRIDEMTGDPFDATYSIKLIAAITPQIEDATLRGEVTQRLKQASRELLASDDDNLQAVLGMISKAENTPFTAIEPKTFPPTPIPTAPGGLNSTQAIRAKLAEAQSLPAHGKARAEAMQSAVVGAIYLGDLPFLGQLVHNIVQDALRQDDAYLVLDSFNWMMPKAGPAAAAEVRAILMKALKVAPEGAHSILLRSVASMMPEQPRAAVECARSLLPIISPGPSRRPTDGQMAMWCYLAKNGYLKEIFPLAQSILESTESA